MIKTKTAEKKDFYAHSELPKPPKGNRYVQVMELELDWDKLAEPCRRAYCAEVGRPTDPVVYVKIFLVGYFEKIVYDTDLAARIHDSIAIREFLGYSLCEDTPDHSSIGRNRTAIAECCRIEDVLAQIVEVCIDEGLVGGQLVATDTSLVSANASLSSLASKETGESVQEYLKEVKARNQAAAEAEGAEAKKEQPKVSNEEFESTTDPDARIAKKPSQPRDMCYKAVHVTDDENGIIVAAGAARADLGDIEVVKPLIEEAKDNLAAKGIPLEKLTADTAFDSAEFHGFAEDLGIEPTTFHHPDTSNKPEGFKKESFTYYEEADRYICPHGCLLRYKYTSNDLLIYESSPKDCKACPDREKCVGETKRQVRSVSRHPREESRERNIARCHTDEGREILGKRKHIVEPPFGHMKTYGGLSLISCRGLTRANVKVVMAAVAYNLIKLINAKARKAASKAVSQASGATIGTVWAALRLCWSLIGASRASYSPREPHIARNHVQLAC